MKKSLPVILVVFVVPIGVVLFLQLFGNNRFDVPILHQTEEGGRSECLSIEYPYTVPDNLLAEGQLTMVIFLQPEKLSEELRLQVIRLCDKSANTPIKLKSYSIIELENTKCLEHTLLSSQEINELRQCVYLMEKGKNAVLIDGKGNIRGYYDISDREEVDRFAVEKDILINNEEHQSH